MPPLICASPVILDQSFPRGREELLLVSESLGELQDYIERDEVHLLLSEGLRELVEAFEWESRDDYPLLLEIHRLLSQWFLQTHDRLIDIEVSEIEDYQRHPWPANCSGQGLVELWSDEIGRILVIHDACCPANSFFIGIACDSAFSGGELGSYNNPNGRRAFPLVGPLNLDQLVDAYAWDVPSNIHSRSVSFDQACQNCYVIGAIAVDPPSGGSHYKVRFQRRRPWTLDRNYDPVLESHLAELTAITGLPKKVIKYALIEGEMPERYIRFEKVS